MSQEEGRMSDFDVSEAVGELDNMVNAAWDAGYAKGVDWAKKCGGGIDAMTDAELAERGLMRLPVDADGKVIRIGDKIDVYQTKNVEVVGVGDQVVFTHHYMGDYHKHFAADCRYHHAPTVEEVMQEMLEQAVGYSDAHTTAALNAIAKFAAKLRLAGENA